MLTAKSRFVISMILIFSGVAMTILSAILNYYIVSKNMDQIDTLTAKSQGIEQLINELWQTNLNLEQKKDTATILLATGTAGGDYLIRYIRSVYDVLDQPPPDAKTSAGHYRSFLELIGKQKITIIDTINDMYLEKIEADTDTQKLNNENSFFGAVALFLQMMGMMLVLLKHIFD